MSPTTAHDGDLDQVIELNRLFLRLLKTRAENRRACFGLDGAVVRRLREVPAAHVDSLAELPRALFSLDLGTSASPGAAAGRGETEPDGSTQSLQLTALLTAWNFSRRNAYAARLFLGLTARQVGALKRLPLSDLPPLAASAGLIGCAFAQTTWLWRELLSATGPEQRRQLLLVALQPQTLVAADPARRALGG